MPLAVMPRRSIVANWCCELKARPFGLSRDGMSPSGPSDFGLVRMVNAFTGVLNLFRSFDPSYLRK
jgi:hypothetical protein